MDSLQGKVALLTGAGGGLGSEMARALGREGVQLALSGRGEAALRRLAAELAESGVRCVTLPADLSDREQVGGLVAPRLAERLNERLGLGRMFRPVAETRGTLRSRCVVPASRGPGSQDQLLRT